MAEHTVPPPVDLPALKRRLGSIGVWLGSISAVPAAEARRAATTIERLGYSTLWFGETPTSKEALANAAVLLCATERLILATGIANIYGRDATAAANGARTLVDAWPERFVLGLGVSHAPLVTSRGHDYSRPVSTMRAYLDTMDATAFSAPLVEEAPRLLAALRPKMLELAATRAQGAHPYFVTPEHTAQARRILGSAPVLAPEQAVVVDTDSERARATARRYMALYLALPNYLNNLRDLGFSDADFQEGGSDALVDAIVPTGDADTVAERVRAHHTAGADHVAVQPLAQTLDRQLDQLRLLAPLLTG
ncbi:TIGR03620 family F420-dependent LLM class oxidoreductase [Streptosporangium sp. NBC_01755]|uniref:TIGR03620 family F420-dependent LLM class oxidoreductase n=1 Tax=unclassified Streptosporangium TaxID=2632669 RepID=UPI002DD84DCD|nr:MULTISPECIES: TIGR03620 family F420-dependent LLM class oxidoreductase [unclassified Streptosporangium]WSA23290.1 TIGR03620 family F420-dependent LLM class oxidoreductase [Streptosporangium sp. NBC_01810]WSC98572.1 TIGR03620 family F420-dependent LLM class oxidoreductase [Streptosporangium sp. NBC_01755]